MNDERLQIMNYAHRYLLRLLNATNEESEKCRNNSLKDYSAILSIAEGLKFSLESIVILTDIADRDPNFQEKAKSCIEALSDALQNQDNVALVDTLQYEISDMLNEWREIYKTLLS